MDLIRRSGRHELLFIAPQLPIDQAPRANSLRISLDTPLLFASMFRWLGAPDLFARASVGFMRLRPEYTGEVHFLAPTTVRELVTM